MATKHNKVAAAALGEHVFAVSPGKKAQIGFDNAGGNTYDVIAYAYTNAEDASRIKWVLEGGRTTALAKTTLAGFVEVGIEITVAGAGNSRLEVLESKV